MIKISSFSFVFSFLFSLLFVSVSFAESPMQIAGATTISPQEAKRLHENGAIFIDVRDRSAWDYGHISGAMHLNFVDGSLALLYVSEVVSKETPLVFYCDNSLMPTAAMASFFAMNWGYRNIYFYRDGYFSWLASDFPIDREIALAQ